MTEQLPIKVAIMRGGTSKGVFFRESDLPNDIAERDAIILAVMGSPDPRQIDGLGGADPLTSKVAIIGPGRDHDADVTYTFGQIGIDEAYVAITGNCGNISAAVGVYAIEEGFVPIQEPVTPVRIFNTNARQILVIHVPIRNGRPAVAGDCAIDGVPGTGAEIRMDFSRTAGATTGKILPTGNVVDDLFIPEFGKSLPVSIVDVAKATLYFHAADIGMSGTEGPEQFTEELLQKFWAVRKAAAIAIGLGEASRLPTPVAVAAPAGYTNYMTKKAIDPETMSFVARRVIGPPPRLHKAFASTGAVCTAAAAGIKGTIVNQVCRHFDDGIVRIGHPTGVFPVKLVMNEDNTLREASYYRTARRIMDGTAYVAAGRFKTD